MYRVNNGGPALTGAPEWAVDTVASPSPHRVAGGAKTSFTGATIDLTHPSVPSGTPMALFQTERWDPAGSPEMAWSFPTTPGAYEVRLFFAETFGPNFLVGARVFDVGLEGATVLDNFDVFAEAGAQRGIVKTFTVQADADIDLSFGHVVQNPIINGIEIRAAGSTAQPTLTATPADVQFASTNVGSTADAAVQLTNTGAAGSGSLTITSTSITGTGAGAFSDSFDDATDVVLTPGQSTTVTAQFAPTVAGSATANLVVQHTGSNAPTTISLNGTGTTVGQPGPVSFGKSSISGLALPAKPTSLQWGPDGRLYVAQNDGTVSALTLQRNGPNAYQVLAIENIVLIKNMPNHNDDGVLNPDVKKRLVTGLLVSGTAASPVVYAVSSDPRIGGGTSHIDLDLDTNSGVLSRLDKSGGSWVKTDLVRGLPRSEENHMSNGLALDPATGNLLIAQGGNTNHGAPSDNFALLPEFALSAAVLSVDLDAIGSTTFDLATLDDQDRPGANDANDPFGGNDGKNQAKLVAGSPVQVYAPGFRNPYDLAMTATGLYTIDNGGNAGWGGAPVNEGPGANCTNAVVNGGPSLGDSLHRITGAGYYGGHPNPTRGNVNNTFNPTNPQAAVAASQPGECDFVPLADRGALALFPTSTNGLTQFTTGNFGGALAGDLITASYNNSIYRIDLNATGTAATVATLFSSVGNFPLDITAASAADPYPGTLWVADYATKAIIVYEPSDFGGGPPPTCTGANDATLDEDGDGFDNADEIANGTDPCSAADLPPDADGDHESDLLDPDDDNDGIADPNDPFALDPDNGSSTQLPIEFTWDNDAPEVGGILGLGFTGIMTNGSAPWSTQYDPDNMTVRGAAGVVTIDEVPAGDALGSANSQQYGFQVGIDASPTTNDAFTVRTRLTGPYAAQVPQNGQSMGLQVGPGNQDNYLKIVAAGSGGGQLQLVRELGGVATTLATTPLAMPGPNEVDLYLEVDPDTATVQASFDTTTNGVTTPRQNLGAPATVPSSWFGSGFALGLIATSGGASSPLLATWDFLSATPVDTVPPTEVWQSLAPMPNKRESVTLVEVGGYLYLGGGGCQGSTCLGTHRRYDPLTNTWTSLRALPANLSHMQAVTVNGLIYYIGGQLEPFPGDEVDTVHIYNPATNTFTAGTPMPAGRGRAAHGVAVHNGQIYVAGGLIDGHYGTAVSYFDRYDPATGVWTTLPNMPRVRDHFHAAVVGNKLYAMGGRNSPVSLLGALIPQIDVFDFTTGTWSTLPFAIPTQRAGAGTVVVGNEVIILGGETPTGVVPAVEAYDTVAGTWRALPPMLTPRHGMQAAVCKGGIYVAGGSTAPTNNPSSVNEVLKLASFLPCR
jgi:hypothetical protein